MASNQVTTQPGSYSIPLGVFCTLLQEHGKYVNQWQNYAGDRARDAESLQGRIAKLERENDELRVHKEALHRIADTQRELIHSLERDLHQAISSAAEFSVPSSTPSRDFELTETNSYPADPLLALVEHSTPAETDVGGLLKKQG